ncbi:hypothetical protein SS50377_25449 [Spironucleus salmonicida]|uniref:Uncharacterized protein n=1 Tax=Spironucleus salmonicida TaxID=348837 RepID=V6LKB1_9EUKA|nr:hypothetical protein SS50377_25449 [Spironucleus salmonicida]|eukprot:EST44997.1 Hypothetical protein SS50377_15016 [Spironucleus salmonicida]
MYSGKLHTNSPNRVFGWSRYGSGQGSQVQKGKELTTSSQLVIPTYMRKSVFKSSLGFQKNNIQSRDRLESFQIDNLIKMGAPIASKLTTSNKSLKVKPEIKVPKKVDKLITYNLLEIQGILKNTKNRIDVINLIIKLSETEFKNKTFDYKPLTFHQKVQKNQKTNSILKSENVIVSNAINQFYQQKKKQCPVGEDFVDYLNNLKIANNYNITVIKSLEDIANDIFLQFIHHFDKVMIKAKAEKMY